MKRKKVGQYIVSWSSVSKDGFRVKHRIWRESAEGFGECIWHVEIRLTDDPVTISEGRDSYEVYPRQFFGKVWIAQRVECKKDATWKAIGEAVRQLELEEVAEVDDYVRQRRKEEEK